MVFGIDELLSVRNKSHSCCFAQNVVLVFARELLELHQKIAGKTVLRNVSLRRSLLHTRTNDNRRLDSCWTLSNVTEPMYNPPAGRINQNSTWIFSFTESSDRTLLSADANSVCCCCLHE